IDTPGLLFKVAIAQGECMWRSRRQRTSSNTDKTADQAIGQLMRDMVASESQWLTVEGGIEQTGHAGTIASSKRLIDALWAAQVQHLRFVHQSGHIVISGGRVHFKNILHHNTLTSELHRQGPLIGTHRNRMRSKRGNHKEHKEHQEERTKNRREQLHHSS